MLNRNKKVSPAAVDSQAPVQPEPAELTEPETPAVEPESPEGIAAEIERVRAAASEIRERAGQSRAEAEPLVTAARAEAERLVREATMKTGQLRFAAERADREAETLEGRARGLAVIAGMRARVAEAERHVAELLDERERVTGQVAKLEAKITGWTGERQAADRQLAEARGSEDVDSMTTIRARIASYDDLIANAGSERATAQSRAAAIGDDGERGELTAARKATGDSENTLARHLNAMFPERPEAIGAERRAQLRALADVTAQRAADAEVARKRQAPRTVVIR